jgi:hypothetical protein
LIFQKSKAARTFWQLECLHGIALRFGQTKSPRLLRYHVGLLLLSQAPHWR